MLPLIAIKSCEAHRHRVSAQLKTWGAYQVPIRVYTGPLLGVPDDYVNLPVKVKEICRDLRDREFVFLMDTDTYVVPERLLNSGFEQHDYSGCALTAYNIQLKYASGGAGYWLSKKALNILADADWSKVSGCDANEDMHVGYILAQNGITLHHDPRYALYESPLPDNEIISEHLSSRGPFEIQMMYDAHGKMNP
jgi:hypothetical protein